MDCPICLEQNNNEMITTACNHVFHKSCLDEWKKINLSCPCCRNKIGYIIGQNYKVTNKYNTQDSYIGTLKEIYTVNNDTGYEFINIIESTYPKCDLVYAFDTISIIEEIN